MKKRNILRLLTATLSALGVISLANPELLPESIRPWALLAVLVSLALKEIVVVIGDWLDNGKRDGSFGAQDQPKKPSKVTTPVSTKIIPCVAFLAILGTFTLLPSCSQVIPSYRVDGTGLDWENQPIQNVPAERVQANVNIPLPSQLGGGTVNATIPTEAPKSVTPEK